jgi:hypothetical protein
MKRLTAILCLLLATTAGFPATVVFNLTDFLTGQITRKQFQVQRITAVSGNTTNVITGEIKNWNTGTNGIVIATNMVVGMYQCKVFGSTATNVFRIYVVDTNGTLTASQIITSMSSSAIDMEDGTPLDIE